MWRLTCISSSHCWCADPLQCVNTLHDHYLQVQKTSLLTPNVGMVYSGMGPDYRVLVRKARKQAQAYYRLYHEHIPVAQLVRETAAVMQEFTRALPPSCSS